MTKRTLAQGLRDATQTGYAHVGMLGNDYKQQACSLAGALEVVGERWSLLIVRDVFLGLRRFDQIQADLGIARNVLQARLERLVGQGVLERSLYQERPARYEYRLTEKGIDLWPIVVSLMQWGDRHTPPAGGPAVVLEHRGCGGAVDDHRVCEKCGKPLGARDVRALPGPGARPSNPLIARGKRVAA
jgi:DNA-binding HxlR family transcriptional regulator